MPFNTVSAILWTYNFRKAKSLIKISAFLLSAKMLPHGSIFLFMGIEWIIILYSRQEDFLSNRRC